ncbi:AsnC family transcriptional regulator [Chloroflexota bacterium]
MTTRIDDIDKKLVSLIQRDFPITEEPFSALGERLDISGEQVIQRVEKLKKEGIVRLIGPVFDARKLGYQTTLVAMKVAESRLNEAARVISEHTWVSHAYQRNHDLNLWFTLAQTADTDVPMELQRLKDLIGAEVVINLPALKVFKIGAYFDMYDDSSFSDAGIDYSQRLSTASHLSVADRDLINGVERDIPLILRPFDAKSAELGLHVDQFLDSILSLKQRGVIRRFGAAINHNNAGFRANAMACWIVEQDKVDKAGQKLAEIRQVSHCYERKTNPLWSYNLFAMIHGHTREICEDIIGKISGELGLNDYMLLFSTREFKKTRVSYVV